MAWCHKDEHLVPCCTRYSSSENYKKASQRISIWLVRNLVHKLASSPPQRLLFPFIFVSSHSPRTIMPSQVYHPSRTSQRGSYPAKSRSDAQHHIPNNKVHTFSSTYIPIYQAPLPVHACFHDSSEVRAANSEIVPRSDELVGYSKFDIGMMEGYGTHVPKLPYLCPS